MARTVQDVITSARGTLNDADGTRNTDAEIIGFVVDGLNGIKTIRPDLFIGRFTTSIGTLVAASSIPVDEQFFRSLVDYVIARCETKDDELVNSGRAELMAKMAAGSLL